MEILFKENKSNIKNYMLVKTSTALISIPGSEII